MSESTEEKKRGRKPGNTFKVNLVGPKDAPDSEKKPRLTIPYQVLEAAGLQAGDLVTTELVDDGETKSILVKKS